MSAPGEPLLRIGVDIDPSQHGPDRRRLLDAVEAAFDVRFEPLAAIPPGELSGVVTDVDGALGGADELGGERRSGGPASDRPLPAVPILVLASGSSPATEAGLVTIGDSERLARPLRGRSIEEGAPPARLQSGPAWECEPQAPLSGAASGPQAVLSGAAGEPRTILATAGGEPVWWRLRGAGGSLYFSRYPLAGIGAGEALRERLRGGDFMGLLPLIHFLTELLGERGWQLPPLRASFVVDDPNLHWTSYGFLKYGELVSHAADHGYHLGLATVPLDGWRADRRASALLARGASSVSLLMHGNDHVARELGRLDRQTAVPAIAQALRRTAALERRSGLRVQRVMAPPHGACSEEALRAMFRLGIEAACISRPYPWLDGQPAPGPLAGWAPAELVAGGLPVLPRHPLGAPREELVFRALLGQPLILYGHHEDFADGLDVLARATADIEALGEVRWGPLEEIARASCSLRMRDDRLLVRLHARQVSIRAPAGARSLEVLMGAPMGGAAGHTVRHPGGSVELRFEQGLGRSELIEIEPPGPIELSLLAAEPLQAEQIPAPPLRVWPSLRRAAVEGRDRLAAQIGGARRR